MVGPKKYDFWPRINIPAKKMYKKFLRGISVRQKLGVILASKVVQKLSLEKNVFTKKWSPKLIILDNFFFEKIQLIFDIEN